MPWITVDDVQAAFGPSTPFVDDPNAQPVVDAADAWAQRKRVQAGYVDDPDVAPDAAAKQGTVLYAVALYRERASTDSYPSFAELAGGPTLTGSMGQIRRLLGIGRAAVDAPALDVYPFPFRGRRAHPSAGVV